MMIPTFRIEVPDRDLSDLSDRLARVRWAPEPLGGDGRYGVSRARVEQLATHWCDRYDWRVWEARLNAYPQFRIPVDGTAVHFLHVRSPEDGALPLILSHGWPGSVAEFLDIIGPLTDPRAHGLDPNPAFDLVIPSLPGFGWSGPTADTGWGPRRIAAAWLSLMRRIGYHRFGAVGNDWGSYVSLELARLAPPELVGVHVTQLDALPDGESANYPPTSDAGVPAELSAADRGALAGLRYFQQSMGAYHHVHTQQPQTLAHALSDSPVGLLAWASQCMGDLDPEMLLTHVSIHWLTGTAGSALRIYADHQREQAFPGRTTVPLGLASFANDVRPIAALVERDHANLRSWRSYDVGGHYAARQAPEVLVEDIRCFFADAMCG